MMPGGITQWIPDDASFGHHHIASDHDDAANYHHIASDHDDAANYHHIASDHDDAANYPHATKWGYCLVEADVGGKIEFTVWSCGISEVWKYNY